MKSSTSKTRLGFVFHEFYLWTDINKRTLSIIYNKFKNVISRESPEEVPLCDLQLLIRFSYSHQITRRMGWTIVLFVQSV